MRPIITKRKGLGPVEVWDIEHRERNVGSIVLCIDRYIVTRRFRDRSLEIAGRFGTLEEAKNFVLTGGGGEQTSV